MVTSVYKPPNERFSFRSYLRSPQMNVVIGELNIYSVTWGYISTGENDQLVEKWSEYNQLCLVHDTKQFNSFISKRWRQGYNIAFVSDSIAHQIEKCVMEVIPKSQHRPISIKINSGIKTRNVPFQNRYNFKQPDLPTNVNHMDKGNVNITPRPKTMKSL